MSKGKALKSPSIAIPFSKGQQCCPETFPGRVYQARAHLPNAGFPVGNAGVNLRQNSCLYHLAYVDAGGRTPEIKYWY
jgi:hypothetical protein